MNNPYIFGYPDACSNCQSFSNGDAKLRVLPFYKEGKGKRVMVVGQDPTIFRDPLRVTHALMLDQGRSQISRWLHELFGKDNFKTMTLYATNLVKCSFSKPPSTTREGGYKFLQPYFRNCKSHISSEINHFQPELVITLGEPAHKLFISILDNSPEIPATMQGAFKGAFYKAHLGEISFDYSPCLHIKTYRVAEVYGENVVKFKSGIKKYFE